MMIWKSVAVICLAFAAVPALAAPIVAVDAMNDLLAEEKRLSAAASTLAPADALETMMAQDVRLYTRGGPFKGRASAVAALKANPANQGTGISLRSVKSGISGDGAHGFTFGYLTIAGGDPKSANRRYLAYWIKRAEGWRIAALKQAPRQTGEAELAGLPASVPTKAGTAAEPAAALAGLIAAEKAFSDRAQIVGLGKAFEENGRSDAVNSAPDGVKVGPAVIGAAVSGGDNSPSPVEWSADEAIVAPSGDLGITFGMIRQKQAPPPGQPGAIPFFTIWMRDGPDQPWRYVAE